MDEVKWDGIVGLALPTEKMKNQGVLPVMDQMMHDNVLKKKG